MEVGASKQFVDDYTTIAQKFERGDIYTAFYDDGALVSDIFFGDS